MFVFINYIIKLKLVKVVIGHRIADEGPARTPQTTPGIQKTPDAPFNTTFQISIEARADLLAAQPPKKKIKIVVGEIY